MHKLLIVDDNAMNLDILRDLLQSEYKLSMAKNGMIALKILGKQTPDVILLDIMMPIMDGYETFKNINEDSALNGIPVIFLSGVDVLDENLMSSSGDRYVEFIKKPFNISEVKLKIGEAIKSRGEL